METVAGDFGREVQAVADHRHPADPEWTGAQDRPDDHRWRVPCHHGTGHHSSSDGRDHRRETDLTGRFQSPPPDVPQVGAHAVAQGPAFAGHNPHHKSEVLPWRIETNLARGCPDGMAVQHSVLCSLACRLAVPACAKIMIISGICRRNEYSPNKDGSAVGQSEKLLNHESYRPNSHRHCRSLHNCQPNQGGGFFSVKMLEKSSAG